MRVFGNEFQIRENSMRLTGDNIESITVPLDEVLKSKLEWLVKSDTETTLRYDSDRYEIFFGPYIMQSTTGYVLQVIDLSSRVVITSRYPFGAIHLADIKEDLRRVYNG